MSDTERRNLTELRRMLALCALPLVDTLAGYADAGEAGDRARGDDGVVGARQRDADRGRERGDVMRAKLVQEVIDGKRNPFWTLEALGEHVNVMWGLLSAMDFSVWDKDERGNLCRPHGTPGTMVYHLRAIDDYERDLFNLLAALMPDVRAASEGDMDARARIEALFTPRDDGSP